MFVSSLFTEDLDHVLGHTQGLWDELRGQRLFITGGTGFFGTWLVETFVWANDQLGLNAHAVILSRNPQAFLAKIPHLAGHPAVSFEVGELRDFEFPKGRFTHVIHAAVDVSPRLSSENPLRVLDSMVAGTRRVLDFAVRCGVNKFLLTSSGAVYGRQPPDLTHVPEEYIGAPDPLDAGTAYGQGKRLAEHLCALYARQHGIEAKVARGFAFVGPHLPLDQHFAIGNFIRDGLHGGPIMVRGDGTPYRSYLYAADMAIWLWAILMRGGSCRPYNLGSSNAMDIAAVANTVASVFGPGVEVHIAQRANQQAPPERYVPSTARARDELGLRQIIEIRDAISRTARWQDPAAKLKGCDQ